MTVAHRLHTIMDSDRCLILAAGRVLEFDTPQNLMKVIPALFSLSLLMTWPSFLGVHNR